MTLLAPDQLVETLTPEEALEQSLDVAETAELPTTSWVEGDDTLTIIEILSYWVATERDLARKAIEGGWLDFAEEDWLTLTAKQVYDVDRIDKTFAECELTITNGGSTDFTFGAEDVTFENTSTGKTYRNLDPSAGTVTLNPGESETVTIIADEAGADSSADIGDIDNVVSGLVGATCTNTTAAVGFDDESDEALRARCRLKVPAISKTASGPKGKYAYMATTPTENGGANVTRCAVNGDGTTGTVEVILASASGAVSGGDITLVETALVNYVIGPCETLIVTSAVNETVNIAYAVWVYDDVNATANELFDQINTRLGLLFSVCPVGGWRRPSDPNGKVFVNMVESTIFRVSSRIFQVTVLLDGGGDVDLDADEVPVLGTIIGPVTFAPAPPTGGTL